MCSRGLSQTSVTPSASAVPTVWMQLAEVLFPLPCRSKAPSADEFETMSHIVSITLAEPVM